VLSTATGLGGSVFSDATGGFSSLTGAAACACFIVYSSPAHIDRSYQPSSTRPHPPVTPLWVFARSRSAPVLSALRLRSSAASLQELLWCFFEPREGLVQCEAQMACSRSHTVYIPNVQLRINNVLVEMFD
jgi:hypothetical protein